MNIKSLLLGSAAALAVTSGAQAADAIMAAQPEPVDYVRVCDAFGTGYFYIPGTETCLKLSGYVREDVGFGDINGADTDGDGLGDATAFHTRFTFMTDTKSNTELGVLHTYTSIRFNYFNTTGNGGLGALGGGSADLHYAFIELGGFRVGKTESEFDRLQFYGNGYAGGVIQDTLVPYGPFDAQQISYTYKNGPFSAVLALEDDQTDGDNYIPDVLGGLAYNNGTFGAAIIGALDEDNEVVPGVLGGGGVASGDTDGAVKVRVDGKFGRFQAFLMGGYSTNGGDSNGYEQASNRFANWGGDWAVWGGASADLTQKISANLQLSYDDASTFGAAGNLVFHVVPGFDVTTELDYKNVDNPAPIAGVAQPSYDAFGGVIRFQRTF